MSSKRTGVGFLALVLLLGSGVCAPTARAGAEPSDWRSTIARVARECGPSVVHIEVTDRKEPRVRADAAQPERSPEPFFGRPDAPRAFKEERKGLGTGMVLDTGGNILTNAHVVTGAAGIEVTLTTGERAEATLVGADPKTDLAVIRIPGKSSLKPVVFGDSDRLEVGEWVVAIGHPRGLDHTVTQGIVSAKHRRGITDPTSYEDFLQTDAAINPGNSGGPLLNLEGHVIGVNAVIASTSGGSEGIGFAIPSTMAQYVVKQLIAKGHVERGWLGVTTEPLTPEKAKALNVGEKAGALVAGVVDGGPAGKAGMRRGFLVTGFDGKPVESDLDLRNRVAAKQPGEVVPVRVLADGWVRELSVTVGDLGAVSRLRTETAEKRLGVTVREITPDETKLYRLKPSAGVVLASVDPNGAAAAQGLEVGDVLVEIQGQPVDSPEKFGMFVSLLPPTEEGTILAVDHRTGEAGYLRFTAK